jgi:uncharacterized protein (DUF1330 family)
LRGRLPIGHAEREVVEGLWGRDKLIVLAFPDREAARRWSASPEYRAIAVDRLAATDGVVLLADGVGP